MQQAIKKEENAVVSQMPQLNKTITSDDGSLPVSDIPHLQYLQVSIIYHAYVINCDY